MTILSRFKRKLQRWRDRERVVYSIRHGLFTLIGYYTPKVKVVRVLLQHRNGDIYGQVGAHVNTRQEAIAQAQRQWVEWHEFYRGVIDG